jgi:hypothetical protein
MPRPDWSRPLPRQIVILDGYGSCHAGRCARAAWASAEKSREKSTWQHVEAELNKAAAGADPADVSVALRLVLSLEGVTLRGRGHDRDNSQPKRHSEPSETVCGL